MEGWGVGRGLCYLSLISSRITIQQTKPVTSKNFQLFPYEISVFEASCEISRKCFYSVLKINIFILVNKLI